MYATATKFGSVKFWAGEFNKTISGEVRSLYFYVADERAARDAIMQEKKNVGTLMGWLIMLALISTS